MPVRFSAWWGCIASRRKLSIFIVALIPLIGRLLIFPVMPFPNPAVHDEFSHLLAAATFAKGRLTNPTPPMWQHFETFHVLMQPTYMSVYPPGQGALLALGEVLFGHPWWSVYLSIGLMCAVLTWMLYAWLPPRWALLGGVLAGLQFGFAHYWINSYWGGSLAAIGGALVLGAFPRLQHKLLVRYSVLFGIGLVVLANTRPFEGLLTCTTLGIAMFLWLRKRDTRFLKSFALRVALPVGLILLPTGVVMARQIRAVTGSVFAMPHEVYRREVAVWPTFAWQPPRPAPVYRHEELRSFFIDWEPNFQDAKEWGTLRGIIPGLLKRVRVVGACYSPHAAYLPFALISLIAIGLRRTRVPGAAIMAVFLGTLLVKWTLPHYLAPVLGAMLAIHLQFLRYVRAWKWKGWPAGSYAFCGILALLFILFAGVFARRIHPYVPDWSSARAQFLRQLESTPGQHLVFVRYAPKHIIRQEWVYNEPDIPAAKVIWARTMSPAENQELEVYFKGRTFWVVEADAQPPVLRRSGIMEE